MDKSEARGLIDRYFTAWLEADREAFLSCLHPQAVVRECNGSAYAGRQELERWFRDWNRDGNRVQRWDILAAGFDEQEVTAFVEWEFRCVYEQAEYGWLGVSIIRFADGVIREVNEYERR